MTHTIQFSRGAWLVITTVGTMPVNFTAHDSFGEALASWASLHGAV